MVTVRQHQIKGALVGRFHSFLRLPRMAKYPYKARRMSPRKQPRVLMWLLATIHSHILSAASSLLPTAPVAADARGESPRAKDYVSQIEIIYSGELDGGSDSKMTPRSPGSPGATDYEPSHKTLSFRLMLTTRVCLVGRMRTLTHTPRLLLHIRRLENATMARVIVMATLVVLRLPLVPHRRH